MTRVVAIILHAVPDSDAGPLERAFEAARRRNAERQAAGLSAAGAAARIETVVPGGAPFGARLRALAAADPAAGLVILGSGSVPFARPADLADVVAAAAGDRRARGAHHAPAHLDRGRVRGPGRARGRPVALVNNRYSADILAIPAGIDLAGLPDVASDNAVPRWLEEHGVEVDDLRGRTHLQLDLDSPIDVALAGLPPELPDRDLARARAAASRLRERSRDPGSELVVAGRTSAATVRWLERRTASRTRALIEERGFRTARAGQRAPRSTLGLLLERDGSEALGPILATLGDAAVVDIRVLLAHRLGADERGWPRAEDRFASDLLLHERIADPWLRALTASAATAPIPILLGGHTLAGPGLPRLIRAGLG